MIYRGRFTGGVVVLDGPVDLPEGTVVQIEPLPSPAAERTLAQQFADVIGSVPDLPKDMAARHDLYLHGTPNP